MHHLIKYFIQFKKFTGNKIYYLLCLILIYGFVEGVGITLFLPILQNGFGEDKLSHILRTVFDFFHVNFSFTIFLALILLFFILRSLLLIYYARYFGKLFTKIIIALRRTILTHIFDADYLYLLKKEIGYINNIIIRETSYVVEAFHAFSKTLRFTVYGLIYIVLSLLLSFKVTLVLLFFVPFLIMFVKRINSLTTQASRDITQSYGRFHSIVIQVLSKLKYLKATLSHTKISGIMDNENKKMGDSRFKLFFLQSLSIAVFEPLVVFMVVGLFFYYVAILKKNTNEVMFLIFLFLQIARQFLGTQNNYRKFLAVTGSIEVLRSFEKELKDNKEDLNLDGVSPEFGRKILFKGVTLTFPNGKHALDNINMTIKPKSIVALVGHSGSGKSTIANVVAGILRPTKGDIFLGDTNYDRLNLRDLRENIAYVTQEDIIFNASIKDNISLWDEHVDLNKLEEVIEIAHITNFIKGLSNKENEMLGDNGLDISGGQRQRITMARELYKDAQLLIMDEATSSLDSKSENRIYEKLKEFKGVKTMLIIAHRLSTIKNADYIYVIDNGRIVEEGTYQDLNQKKGEFADMVTEQKLT